MSSILVAYGVPPNHIHLYSSTGRDLHKEGRFEPKTFDSQIRRDFEQQLRAALSTFMIREIPDIAHADYRFIGDARTLQAFLHTRKYREVIYYGHAIEEGSTLKPLQKISAIQLRHALEDSGVTHIDFLGCKSTTLAAHLASARPDLSVGNLRGRRFDDIE